MWYLCKHTDLDNEDNRSVLSYRDHSENKTFKTLLMWYRCNHTDKDNKGKRSDLSHREHSENKTHKTM